MSATSVRAAQLAVDRQALVGDLARQPLDVADDVRSGAGQADVGRIDAEPIDQVQDRAASRSMVGQRTDGDCSPSRSVSSSSSTRRRLRRVGLVPVVDQRVHSVLGARCSVPSGCSVLRAAIRLHRGDAGEEDAERPGGREGDRVDEAAVQVLAHVDAAPEAGLRPAPSAAGSRARCRACACRRRRSRRRTPARTRESGGVFRCGHRTARPDRRLRRPAQDISFGSSGGHSAAPAP